MIIGGVLSAIGAANKGEGFAKNGVSLRGTTEVNSLYDD
jgi:hypothetical protein